ESSVEIDFGNGDRAIISLSSVQGYKSVMSAFWKANEKFGQNERHDIGKTLAEGVLDAVLRWSRGSIKLDTVTAKAAKCTVKQKALLEMATAAWCEAYGVDSADVAARTKEDVESRTNLCEQMIAELKGGKAGIKHWNERVLSERQKISPLRKADFSGCVMEGVFLDELDLQRSKFDGANLINAKIKSCELHHCCFENADLRESEFFAVRCRNASFKSAKLQKAHFSSVELQNTNFSHADLSGAVFSMIDMRGADLSNANLDGMKFEFTVFDEKTKLPPGFEPPQSMIWKGPGRHPTQVKAAAPRVRKKEGITFEEFIEELTATVLAKKLEKATSMLKAEHFQLFSERGDDSLVGIVKSQTSDELVYCCRLESNGSFACCTQNLRPCGGLQGSLCKHLLVLIVGLVKSEQLEPSVVLAWMDDSKEKKPLLDKEKMSDTFLKYKGAEAGEIDWRPTETIPEDYYSL
ncbi:MAG: pentapeptide repeat-containing protein, partial [Cyanobacteria bacterium]|nr:pentapeptide repeat-containing protein [Cyanobacteriota bacterium]